MLGDPIDDLAELLGGCHRRQLGPRELDGDVQLSGVSAVDDGRRPPLAHTRQQPGRLFDGPLGGGQADPLGTGSALQVLETFESERQVRSPLVPGQRVDLVHDDRLHLAEGQRLRPAVTRR